MSETRPRPHLWKMCQLVKCLKSAIQKIAGGHLIVGGDEITGSNQVVIRPVRRLPIHCFRLP